MYICSYIYIYIYICLKSHCAPVKQYTDVNCFQMHCESRITYDSEKCILGLHSTVYPDVIAALRTMMSTVFGSTPQCGPAPPTKAEKKAMRIAGKFGGD